jgi:hypothetical protein
MTLNLYLTQEETELIRKALRVFQKISGAQIAKTKDLQSGYGGHVYGLTPKDVPKVETILKKFNGEPVQR